jgi:uncharacterized protein involved in propanediol utilization
MGRRWTSPVIINGAFCGTRADNLVSMPVDAYYHGAMIKISDRMV